MSRNLRFFGVFVFGTVLANWVAKVTRKESRMEESRMESFKGVMVGATNFRDNLDQAIMSRSAFKLQLDYLDEAGKRHFFGRMFKTRISDEESARLAEVCNLAPGDFRTVRQSMYYLGGNVTNLQRIEALRVKSEVKRDSRKLGLIGFGV